MSDDNSLKIRVTKQGEEAIGKLAQELLENSVVSGALSAAFETRERAMRAQEIAMGALNIPSASDIERLTRRVRSVSQRLEGIEDGLDRVESRLDPAGDVQALEERLATDRGCARAARRALTRSARRAPRTSPPSGARNRLVSRRARARRARRAGARRPERVGVDPPALREQEVGDEQQRRGREARAARRARTASPPPSRPRPRRRRATVLGRPDRS